MLSAPVRTRLAVALAAALAVTAVAAAGTPAAQAAQPGVVPDLTWYIDDATQDRTGALLRDAGAQWVRLHVQWKEAEPFPDSYDLPMLAHFDRAVAVAGEAGSNVLMMVYNAPAWASGSSESNVPRDPADFADFMRFLALRYEGRVQAYEIWNEPNLTRFWSTGYDPAGYTQVLRAGHGAVKAVDPSARIVFAGLSFSDYKFAEGAYAAGAKGYFDAMGVHPYTYCGTRDPEEIRYWDGKITEGSFVAYRNVRAVMVAHGDPKPIWFTEFGWNTSTQTCDISRKIYGGVSEATQAEFIAKAFRIVEQDPYVEVAILYTFRNNYWNDDADVHHARYGLLRTDFSPKPGYFAFRDYALSVARSPAPEPPAPPAPPVRENLPPTVKLTAPAPGTIVGKRLEMRATASDDGGVSRVEFWVGTRKLFTDVSAPYGYTWTRSRQLQRGSHDVVAKAYDAQGLSAVDSVTVTRR